MDFIFLSFIIVCVYCNDIWCSYTRRKTMLNCYQIHACMLYYHAKWPNVSGLKKVILLGHSLPSYYALDSIAILYRYYANIVQWL